MISLKKKFFKILNKIIILKRLYRIRNLRKNPIFGSSEWLCLQELIMGGYTNNVPRVKISRKDPRSSIVVKTGGMIGGDRMIHHNYAPIYEKYLKKFLNKKPSIIEVGILKGTGLAIWSKLFPLSELVGLDIDLSHFKTNYKRLKKFGAFAYKKPKSFEFDQFNPKDSQLTKFLKKKNFEIIIDDGFHSNEAAISTFEYLEQFLSKDFVYFIEDNRTVITKMKKLYPKYKFLSYGEMTVVLKKSI